MRRLLALIGAATVFATCFVLTSVEQASAQKAKAGAAKGKPTADMKDVAYGSHKKQVLDFWKAKGTGPAPVMVFIHGGGFHTGSRGQLPGEWLNAWLENGYAAASVEYRFPKDATFPAQFHDGARAVQFLRSK